MIENGVRDFVGYGRNPPDPQWPGGARLAVNFVLNHEEGSEPAVPDGDPASTSFLTEIGQSPVPRGDRDLAAESMFEYGSRVGFWRIHRLFAERGLPLTLFGCSQALERNPESAAAVREAGWDVCCHGRRWAEHYLMDEATARAEIATAVASITRTVGARPDGWYCRYGPSVNTRRLVVEEGGFVYDSDAYNDELPYCVRVGERPQLVVPYTVAHNDMHFAAGNLATGDDFFTLCRDAFEMLLAEGATRPKMMSIGLHNRLIGHPARATGLARLLDHVANPSGVWISRRVDIARHWQSVHPATGGA